MSTHFAKTVLPLGSLMVCKDVDNYTLLTSSLEGGGWSAPRPGRFTPRKEPVPIVQEAGWAPGPVWTRAKNLAPPGLDSRTVQPRS
jgi:hypothetical protein